MQQRSEETRAHILEAAGRLFSQAGYQATSVADICQAAGISKGAFYHHFPSKQAVFLEILEGWLDRLDQSFDLLRQESRDVPAAIADMATMAGGLFQATDVNLSIFLEFWIQAQRDPAVWEATIEPYRRYQRYFADLIQEGVLQGSLKGIDPQRGARALVSMAVGLLMQALFDPQGADWAQEIQHSVQLLMDGLVRSVE